MSVEMDEQEAMVGDMFNMGTPEGEGEAYIDGTWMVAHVAMRPEIYAIAGLPITKLGEDSIGLTLEVVPGTIKRFESLPLRLGIALKAGVWLAPGAMERANIAIQKRVPRGRRIIEEAGGVEAYDRNAREKLKLFSPMIEVKHADAIVFEED